MSGVPYRPSGLLPPRSAHEWREDGTLLMRSRHAPVGLTELGFSGFVPKWAATRPTQPAFSERNGPDSWRSLTWAQFHEQMLSVAASVLEMGLQRGEPLMLLSGNSLENVVLPPAAAYVGLPTAPVSPAYS